MITGKFIKVTLTISILPPLSPVVHSRQLTSQLPFDMSDDIMPREWVTDAAVLPNTKSLGSNFLASYSLCLFISALETGIIVVLFSRFLARRAFAESHPIKYLVYFVTFIAM